MSQVLAVFASGGYSIATLQAQLTTMHASNPISLLVDGGFNAAEVGAGSWAQTNGVPYLPLDARLSEAGFTAFNKPLGTMLMSQPTAFLCAGTSARTVAASGLAGVRGLPLTII